MNKKPQSEEREDSQNTGHGSKFGRKKEDAIAALLTQRNVEEAARVAGIGTRTLIRWLKIPESTLPILKHAVQWLPNPTRGCSKVRVPQFRRC